MRYCWLYLLQVWQIIRYAYELRLRGGGGACAVRVFVYSCTTRVCRGLQRTCRMWTMTTTKTRTTKSARTTRRGENSDATGRRSALTSWNISNERSNGRTILTSTLAKISPDVPDSPRPEYRLGDGYNYCFTSSRPLFDSHSTAIRPRYTTILRYGLLVLGCCTGA